MHSTETALTKDVCSKGANITLVKQSIKQGEKSGVKPGTKKQITLAKAICVGHPVCAKRPHDRVINNMIAVTSEVQKLFEENGKTMIETKTSFYTVL